MPVDLDLSVTVHQDSATRWQTATLRDVVCRPRSGEDIALATMLRLVRENPKATSTKLRELALDFKLNVADATRALRYAKQRGQVSNSPGPNNSKLWKIEHSGEARLMSLSGPESAGDSGPLPDHLNTPLNTGRIEPESTNGIQPQNSLNTPPKGFQRPRCPLPGRATLGDRPWPATR